MASDFSVFGPIEWEVDPTTRFERFALEHQMAWFLALLFGVIPLFAVLAWELLWLDKKAIKHGYGPRSQVPGHPKATGTLVCVNADAPTLGRSLSSPYAFQATADERHVTAT